MIIGVDVGGTHIRAGLFNQKTPEKFSYLTIKKRTRKEVIAYIIESIREVWHPKVKAIGISCAGIIDHKQGIIVKSPHLPLDTCPLASIIEQEYRVPVLLENDANCFTLAQYNKYGGHLLGITVGTGLGSGMMFNGILYRGNGSAPELGHIPWNSTIVRTKKAEDIISARGLVAIAKSQGVKVKDSKELFSQNNKKVFSIFGEELGKILSVAHLLYDVDRIVIGGEIANAWALFEHASKKSLKKYSMFKVPKINKNTIKHAGVVGAALLVEN